MKILLCADVNSLHTWRWATMAQQAGMEVAVFSLNSLALKEWELFPSIKIFHAHTGITQAQMQQETRFSKVKYLFAVSQLNECIRIYQPHIVHAHYATSYGLISMLSGFKRMAISVWGSDIYNFPRKSFLHAALMKKILGAAKRIHSTGNVMAHEASKYTKTPVEVIPFGIDLHTYFPNAESRNWKDIQNSPIIGTVKSMEKIYGIDLLIHAFAIVQKRIPNATLSLTGGGTQLSEYKKLTERLGIADKVTFHGKIAPSRVPDTLRSLDIFCNLSRRESFGMSILEASACGIPIVATHVDGVVETAQNGVNAVTVDVEDVQAAANAILEILSDEEKYMRLNAGGIKWVKDNFDQSKSIQKIHEFYQRIK